MDASRGFPYNRSLNLKLRSYLLNVTSSSGMGLGDMTMSLLKVFETGNAKVQQAIITAPLLQMEIEAEEKTTHCRR